MVAEKNQDRLQFSGLQMGAFQLNNNGGLYAHKAGICVVVRPLIRGHQNLSQRKSHENPRRY